ncbi:hypothetical protein [Nisaea nitritireducens]|uniref:hypothetical protein n=1 Tax=Nisaea nitritireducens TaxID=568392 RepID=UPI0018669751|nr:hypothetical protein [Nisaea nitritireducens]
MDVSQTAAQPAWWSQSSPSGELDLKEDMYKPAQVASEADDGGWGPDGFGFDDFVDIVNPLQHLPFISTLYREFTGDTIAPAARTAGSALYGGPAGLVAGVANVMFEAEGGSDIGATMIAELKGAGTTPANANALPAEETLLAEAPQTSSPSPVPTPTDGAITPAADQRSFAVAGVQTASTDAAMTPEAMAAYARASALTAPTPGSGSVDWTSGVITQPAAEASPGIQSVSGGGLDALIRSSQAKTATRRRGPALPMLVQPGLKTRGAQAPASEPALPIDPSQRAGLADWMMKALDKYGTMKVSGSGVG